MTLASLDWLICTWRLVIGNFLLTISETQMKKINKTILASILILSACLPVLGQSDNKLLVSGKGNPINYPSWYFNDFILSIGFPEGIPNIKTITIIEYPLKCKNQELSRRDDYKERNILYYDRIGRLERINEAAWENNSYYTDKNHYFIYDDNKLVKYTRDFSQDYDQGREWIYTYDENGLLKQMMYGRDTYIYTLDKRGNITKIDHYVGAYRQNETITCQFNENGRLISYYNSYEIPHEKKWIYDSENRLVSKRVGDTEYRYEYDESKNIIHRVSYTVGDITIINGGSDYEISYTYYPTEEELKRQAEEKRIADSIWQVEQEELRKQQEVEQHRNDSLKKTYQSCRFLFDSRSSYVYCVTNKDQFATEMDIMQLVKKRINNISYYTITGKELRNYDTLGGDMINICNICRSLNNEEIVDYIERELEKFVSARKVLLKAYNKSSYTKYSEFLIYYINKTI